MIERETYEWDEAKALENLAKHGVDFTAAYDLEWDDALTIDHTRDGEARHLTYAPIGELLYAMVWTAREDRIRIISLRRANRREINHYEKETS